MTLPQIIPQTITKHTNISLLLFASVIILLSFVYIYNNSTGIPLANILKQNNITSTATNGQMYYINPSGKDSNSGKNPESAWKTIQKGVNSAKPGDSIILAPGTYFQDITTTTNGTLKSPITITGPKNAVIKGGGKNRIIEINHSHIILQGFTIDGLFGNSKNADGYRDKLIYVQGKQIKSGVTGLKVSNMNLKNAAGECLRLRYFAHDNEIANNNIGPCGIADFKFPSKNKNGEGVYIGTSSTQWNDKKNPTNDPDISTRNWVHHNVFNTQGNECVDIKEGSIKNIIEFNSCTGQKDSESGGFDSRGDENIFRNNQIYDNLGAGVRLGGSTVNGITYGKNNEVYDNTIRGNKNGALNIQVTQQGKICGNKISSNGSRILVGSYDKSLNPSAPCN